MGDETLVACTLRSGNRLVRLHGDERWSEWGEDWWRHVDRIGNLSFATGYWVPDWLKNSHRIERNGRRYPRLVCQLDWGAELCEVTKDELRRLCGPWPDHSQIFREGKAKQDALIEGLSVEERYAVVWIET